MKFQVCRSSGAVYLDDNYEIEGKPIEEAFEDSYTPLDQRTVDDPEKLKDKDTKENWYKKGENHRVMNGMITRDMPQDKTWFVEVKSLKALLDLKAKYGDLVLSNFFHNHTIPTLEIYDSYRE